MDTRRSRGEAGSRRDVQLTGPVEGNWETFAHAEIVELTSTRTFESASGHSIRVILVAGLVVAFISFSFIVRLAAPADSSVPSRTPPAAVAAPDLKPSPSPVVWSEPLEGQAVSGGFVTVRGVAAVALGRVHADVLLGDTTLGSTDTEARPGPVSFVIPVVALLAPVPAELVITQPDRPGTQPLLRRALFLTGAGPVELWRAELVENRWDAWTVIAGFAGATIRELRITVRTAAGTSVVASTAPCDAAAQAGQPSGGSAVGLCTFSGRLLLPRGAPRDKLSVEIQWSDDAVRVFPADPSRAPYEATGSLAASLPTPVEAASEAGP